MKTPRSSIAEIIWPGIPGHAESVLMALQYQLEQSQWWPTETLRSLQLSQIEILLRHTWEIACARRDPESKGMLRAGPAGQLTGMSLDGTPIRDVDSLASAVRHRLPPEEVSPSRATAIIRCDQALKYEHAIHVLGVVHGPRETPLVENVRLERTGA